MPRRRRHSENYGWNLHEGNLERHVPRSTRAQGPRQPDLPEVRYGRGVGPTVIGGFVYRGSRMPAQRGRYFFGDEGSSWIKTADARTLKNRHTLGFTVSGLYSFGENSKGELYVVSGAGPVYKLVDTSLPQHEGAVRRLPVATRASQAGRELYLAGHIPGASFLDVETELSAPPGGAEGGRHPLPAPEDFAGAAGAAGIGNDSLVVAYDQKMNGGAARLWWLLRHFGHDGVAVLRGGSGRLARAAPYRRGAHRGGRLPSEPRDDDVVSAEEIEKRLGKLGFVLVDARAAERYRGEVEPIDPVAGHIPGAVNMPYTDEPSAVDPDADVAVYCGSGITAAVTVLALERAGVAAKLYPGSWSEWSSRGLAVERG